MLIEHLSLTKVTSAILAAAGEMDIGLLHARALNDLGLQTEAMVRIAALIPEIEPRQAALAEARAKTTGIESAPSYVAIMLRLADAYIALHDTTTAEEMALIATSRAAGDPSVESDLTMMETLVSLLARLDLLDEASEYVSTRDDPYVRGALLLSIAAELVVQRRGGEADDFYVEALKAADETAYLSDNLRERIAGGFAANRSYALAVRSIEQIDDGTLRLRAGSELAYHAVVLGGMQDTTREELRLALGGQ